MDVLLTALALAWRNEVISRGGAAEAYPAADLVLIVILVQHVGCIACQWLLLLV